MSLRQLQPSGEISSSLAQNSAVLKQKACVPCRTRKVRCNRDSPCTNCVSWQVECIYPSPIRRCKRHRTKPSAAPPDREDESGATKSQPLDKRLEQVEKVLQELTKFIQSPPVGEAEPSHEGVGDVGKDTEKLEAVERRVQGLVAKRDAIQPFGLEPRTQRVAHARLLHCPLRPFNSASVEFSHLHPSPSQMQICWLAYKGNIDQLVKVLHCPSTERILRKALTPSMALSNSEEALLFAMCFSSITSMAGEQVEQSFGMSQHAALSVFMSATEQALRRADVFTSTNLFTLQALVLFLSFNRFIDEAKFVWAMTGLARRLVSAVHDTKRVFEREMHRRLSWQLWFLDQRAVDDRGQDLSGPADPTLPLNINDADLDPKASATPRPRNGWTEMSLSLIRFEIASISSKIESTCFLPYDKDRMIKECSDRITARYLNFCDDTKPIPWLARHCAEVMTAELQIKLYNRHSSPGTHCVASDAQRKALFTTTLDIVDVKTRLEREPLARKWSWLLGGYLQYQPLAFILSELCHRHAHGQGLNQETADYAWSVAETAFSRWTEESKKAGNGAVLAELMEKARTKREQQKQMEQQRHMDTYQMIGLDSSPSSLGLPPTSTTWSAMTPVQQSMEHGKGLGEHLHQHPHHQHPQPLEAPLLDPFPMDGDIGHITSDNTLSQAIFPPGVDMTSALESCPILGDFVQESFDEFASRANRPGPNVCNNAASDVATQAPDGYSF